MAFFSRYIYTLVFGIIFLFSIVTDWYNGLIIVLFICQLLLLINKIGKGIVLRETIAILYAVTCLIMPIIGYAYYSINNPLARLWIKYMPVSESVYFNYTLPAVAIFTLSITLP